MRIADFGAGSGVYVLGIAKALEHTGHVYALDVQRDLLRRIKNEAGRAGYHNIDVVWCDLERPRASKLADRQLDLVLISNLLFQVERKVEVLSEARRVLKPSGRLAIIDWTDASSTGGWRMGPVKQQIVTKARVLELISEAGFELVKEFEAGAHHYGLMCKPIIKTP